METACTWNSREKFSDHPNTSVNLFPIITSCPHIIWFPKEATFIPSMSACTVLKEKHAILGSINSIQNLNYQRFLITKSHYIVAVRCVVWTACNHDLFQLLKEVLHTTLQRFRTKAYNSGNIEMLWGGCWVFLFVFCLLYYCLIFPTALILGLSSNDSGGGIIT